MTEKDEDKKSAKLWFNLEAPDYVAAEKDNTSHDINPPEFIVSFEPEFAPYGAMPVQKKKENLKSSKHQEVPDHNAFLEYDDVTTDGDAYGFKFLVKQEVDFPKDGLNEGRISRLTLIEDGKPVVHFEKGEWVLPPETPAQIQLIDDIKEEFNETPEKEFTSIATEDKNRGIDR